MEDRIYGHLDKRQLESMRIQELKKLAADMGIDVTGKRKDELVSEIAAMEVGATAVETEDVEPDDEEAEAECGFGFDVEPEDEEPEPEVELDDVKRIQKAYVGPNLPGGMMNQGKILQGTEKSIAAYLAPVLERYPEVEHLMVPMERLNQAKRDVKDRRKLLYRQAEALKASIRQNRGGNKA